jgi:hypothetical protein
MCVIHIHIEFIILRNQICVHVYIQMFFTIHSRWPGGRKQKNSDSGECGVPRKSFRVPFWARVLQVSQPWTSYPGYYSKSVPSTQVVFDFPLWLLLVNPHIWLTILEMLFYTCPVIGYKLLTLILLTWRKWWAPNNASKWQMGFNSAFKRLTEELLTDTTKAIHVPLQLFAVNACKAGT